MSGKHFYEIKIIRKCWSVLRFERIFAHFLLCILVFSCHPSKKVVHYEIPKCAKDEIIEYAHYSLSYNEEHEQANWVAYELTSEELNKAADRYHKFLIDTLISTGTACDADYKYSGYDRGHLAPAADMAFSLTAMKESFYYSNMSPQEPGFNRGIWKKLEAKAREWATENEKIYIVTGPVLNGEIKKSIGENKVSVPHHYYKVILDNTAPEIKGIGFILSNEKSKMSLQNFAVTIDSVEVFTGFDFFPKLPNRFEKNIESTVELQKWF